MTERGNVEKKINKNISTQILKPLIRVSNVIDIGWISSGLICQVNLLESVKENRLK